MDMSPWILLALLGIMAFATYFQTVTGFGLSIIVIGVTSGLDLVPLSMSASVVSLVSLMNCALALPPKKLSEVNWRVTYAVLVGAIPASIAGVVLLDYMSSGATTTLQLLLGAVIIFSGVQCVLKPAPQTKQSSPGRFTVSGAVAGVCGGIFGMPGPPIIFLMYRQPFQITTIRTVLLVVFLFISLTRTVYLAIDQGVDREAYLAAGLSLPLISVMTWLGHRFPPPLSAKAMRRATFAMLVSIGVSLVVPVLVSDQAPVHRTSH
ncbi:sulfite exporter TauE/SafE family protein [Candidimonas sp. SYP-B2681]|nr:sulfite exporter TauE/SafE family protein [Candidimonas sp. SYP-B2681]